MLLWRAIGLVQNLHILQMWKNIMEGILQSSVSIFPVVTVPMALPIAENVLVAMTPLIAESQPQEKDLLTRVLVHLIHPEKL